MTRLTLADRTMRGAGFVTPRIAVCALNPHAGENGLFGREEIEVIAPAVARPPRAGIACKGPFPVGHGLPQGLRRRIRRRAVDVSRPGTDRDQAQGLQSRRHGDCGPRNRLHNARSRHRVRHRRQGCGDDRRARTSGALERAPCRKPQRHCVARPAHLRNLSQLITGFELCKPRLPPLRKPLALQSLLTLHSPTTSRASSLRTQARDIPKDVAHLGKRSVLDGIGLALAGAASQTGDIARRYLDSLGIASDNGSTIIGSELRVPARFAAFANGARDPRRRLRRHAARGRQGPRVRVAHASDRAGAAAGAGIGRARPAQRSRSDARLPDRRRSRMQGRRGDPAAALPARLSQHRDVRLDRRRRRGREAARPRSRQTTRRALGIGATQAGGLRENFGTMTKPFHAGRAAENGVVAAEIAALGLHRVGQRARSGPRILPRGRRRLQR